LLEPLNHFGNPTDLVREARILLAEFVELALEMFELLRWEAAVQRALQPFGLGVQIVGLLSIAGGLHVLGRLVQVANAIHGAQVGTVRVSVFKVRVGVFVKLLTMFGVFVLCMLALGVFLGVMQTLGKLARSLEQGLGLIAPTATAQRLGLPLHFFQLFSGSRHFRLVESPFGLAAFQFGSFPGLGLGAFRAFDGADGLLAFGLGEGGGGDEHGDGNGHQQAENHGHDGNGNPAAHERTS
jgi:hypothetical protein